MYPQMPLQLVHIGAGIGAMWTLVGSLPRVAAHVPLELGELHGGVVALCAAVGLLVGVAVAYVSHQLARGGEGGVTVAAAVGSGGREIGVVVLSFLIWKHFIVVNNTELY